MSFDPPLFWCIGGTLIDHIGRSKADVQHRQSNPGAARLGAGGVALNIACALAANGAKVALMGAVGRDIGADVVSAVLADKGVEDRLIRTDHPTGAYLAIEDADGDLHAGVSDLTALETLSPDAIVAHLAQAPIDARVVVDANLTADQLFKAAARPGWLAGEAVSAPKATRFAPLLPGFDALFCNLSEAGALGAASESADNAAKALSTRTKGPVFCTNGPHPAAVALAGEVWRRTPPSLPAASVTGAGDAFTAAALMALATSATPEEALAAAVRAATSHMEKAK